MSIAMDNAVAELKKQLEWTLNNCSNAMYVPIPPETVRAVIAYLEGDKT